MSFVEENKAKTNYNLKQKSYLIRNKTCTITKYKTEKSKTKHACMHKSAKKKTHKK